jgi:hypothetical protein
VIAGKRVHKPMSQLVTEGLLELLERLVGVRRRCLTVGSGRSGSAVRSVCGDGVHDL